MDNDLHDDAVQARLAALQTHLRELFELSGSSSLSIGILHLGVPVQTLHYGRARATCRDPPNDDTLYNVASFTKLMTAGVVSNLVHEGRLSWDAPIRTYLPEFGQRNDEIGQQASIADFLANRSGLSAQTASWGIMNEDILPNQQDVPRLACHIPAVATFRKSFIYSTWGYALVTSAIERVTGNSFSQCVKRYIFQPLDMVRSTLNLPLDGNAVYKHWVGLDGTSHEFPWSEVRGWCDDTGFGGAVGARSSAKELLLMYQSLLGAYRHQTRENVDYTPGSPFRYARRILSPHIPCKGADIADQAYCLGAYRTRLPGNLSIASYCAPFQRYVRPTIPENENPGRVIFHQAATFTGYSGSMLLDPESESAVFVMANSLPLFDVTDFAAQLVLRSLFGHTQELEFLRQARKIIDINRLVYPGTLTALAGRRSSTPTSVPLERFEGRYEGVSGVLTFSVAAIGADRLRMSLVGKPLTEFTLDHWGNDTFCLVPDRERELAQAMWPFMPAKWRMFVFSHDPEGTATFNWHHDVTSGSKPESFRRISNRKANL